MERFDAVVVGAGASGLMAAAAILQKGGKVLLIERMNRPGRKLLATGNGKCNMTNMDMGGDGYRGSGRELAACLLSAVPPGKLRRIFYRLGLCTVEREGYVYPATEQAKTVLAVLESALVEGGAVLHMGEKAKRVVPPKRGGRLYRVDTDRESYEAFSVVLAAGGKAYPKLGSDGSGYELLRQLGIEMEKPLPALTALISPKRVFSSLAGVRTKGELSIFSESQVLGRERGEIQLTSYGISGIPVFQLSRYAVEAMEKGKKAEAVLDFFPSMDFSRLRQVIRDFSRRWREPARALEGLVHEKWVPILLDESGLCGKAHREEGQKKAWNRLVSLLKAYPIPLDGYRGFDYAQVCQGGARAAELTGQMECRRFPGLFVVGELVDVDGTCGGYNLHWAFASGYTAGQVIGDRIQKDGFRPFPLDV